MTDKDPTLERLTNLTFAFLNADQLGRRFLTGPWVRKNVSGYEAMSDSAFDKAFARDRLILSQVGVPLETVAETRSIDGSFQPGFRLQKEEYSLPEVRFTPEEATVLGLAGELGMRKELAAFARSGWTKLAAAGATRDLATSAEFTTVGDINTITPQALDIILRAGSTGGRITFTYQPAPGSTPTTRVMDPWGLVALRGRLYLVGHDVDRTAPRSFRINRLSNIARCTHPDTPITRAPEGIDLQTVVEESLRRGHVLIDATVAIIKGKATELADIGTLRGSEMLDVEREIYELAAVNRDWLVRVATSHAPHALVLEPTDVREEIIAHLASVRDLHQSALEVK